MTGNQADDLMRNKPARKFHRGTNRKHLSVGPLFWDIGLAPAAILAPLANPDRIQKSLNISSNNNSKTWQQL